MITIDVLGGFQAVETMDVLSSLYGQAKRMPEAGGDKDQKIYILEGHHAVTEDRIKSLCEDDVLLINADDPKIYNHLMGHKGKIITFGFQSKACITASSVVENQYKTLQCCIQRQLPTFGGAVLEQQEFSVTVENPHINVHSILAAVTVALLCDVPTEKISKTIIQ